MNVLIILFFLNIPNYNYSGCKQTGDHQFCVNKSLADEVVDLNSIWILKYCSRGIDLLYLAEFCSQSKLPGCKIVLDGFDAYISDPDRYDDRRRASCRSNSKEVELWMRTTITKGEINDH